MKRASLIAAILLGVLAAAGPAQARRGDDDGFDRRQQFEDRRGANPFAPQDFRRRGEDERRLTPEERRDLRRDIRDAGRDIYERDRRRGRD